MIYRIEWTRTTEVLDYLATQGYKINSVEQEDTQTFAKGTTNYGDPIVVIIASNGDYNIQAA